MTGAGPGIASKDLLQLKGEALPLGDGLSVKATLLREKTLKVWLYDANLPEQKNFTGLEYFPYDARGRITGAFRRNERPIAVSYVDSRQQAGRLVLTNRVDTELKFGEKYLSGLD